MLDPKPLWESKSPGSGLAVLLVDLTHLRGEDVGNLEGFHSHIHVHSSDAYNFDNHMFNLELKCALAPFAI